MMQASMRQAAAAGLLMLALSACSTVSNTTTPLAPKTPTQTTPQHLASLPSSVQQGALIVGDADPAAIVEYAGRSLRISPSGRFAFGVGREATGPRIVK